MPADYGAGLFAVMANLTITESEFIGNNAGQFGGAIVQTDDGFTNIQNTKFEYNNAGVGGGAIGIATDSDADRWVRWGYRRDEMPSTVARCPGALHL